MQVLPGIDGTSDRGMDESLVCYDDASVQVVGAYEVRGILLQRLARTVKEGVVHALIGSQGAVFGDVMGHVHRL